MADIAGFDSFFYADFSHAADWVSSPFLGKNTRSTLFIFTTSILNIMKSIPAIFSIFLLLSLSTACENPVLPSQECDEDQGILVSLEAGPNESSGSCYWDSFSDSETFVVRTQAQYDSLALRISGTNCTLGGFTSVDFSQYSVLSMELAGSGCETKFCLKVEDDDKLNQYRFIGKVIEIGGCEPWRQERFWAVVPKLPEGFTVSFEIED